MDQCLSPTPSVLGGRVLDCLFSNIWKALRNNFPNKCKSHTLQYFCYMMAKHQTIEISTKDHYALCPRVNCNRHATTTIHKNTPLQCAGQRPVVHTHLLIFMWVSAPLNGSLRGSSVHSPQSLLQMQQVLEGHKILDSYSKSHPIQFKNRVKTLFPFNGYGPNQNKLARK